MPEMPFPIMGDLEEIVVQLNDILRDIYDNKLGGSTLTDAVSYTPADLSLAGTSASRLLATDALGNVVSVDDLTDWIATTANLTTTDDGDGTMTLNTVQNINTTSTVTFSRLYITSLNTSRLAYLDGSKEVKTVLTLSSWIAGTADQITVTDVGDGTATLSLDGIDMGVGEIEGLIYYGAR